MKTFIKLFLSLSLVLTPQIGWTNDTGTTQLQTEKQAVEEARKQAQTVIYSIETLKSGLVTADLNQLDAVAGGALVVRLGAEISVRFKTAVELFVHVAKSKNIPEEEKQKLSMDLLEAIGDLYLITARHHRDDPLNMNYAKKATVWDYIKGTLKEFGKIPGDLWLSPKLKRNNDGTVSQSAADWNGASADDKRIPWFWDRMVRNYVTNDNILTLQNAQLEIGELPDTKVDGGFRYVIFVKKKENGNDLAQVERAYQIRKSRVVPHMAVFGSLVGAAVVWAFSGFDYIGMFSGDYSAGNVRVVDAITFGLLGAVALVKTATASFTSMPPMKRLIEMVMDPSKKHEISKLSEPLTSRIFGLKKQMETAKGQVACKLSVTGL
ncbi:MAG: hypothetical protein ACK5V3_11550 [Bdellovibrionales bacterium]